MAKKRFRDKKFAASADKSRQLTRGVNSGGDDEAELTDDQVGGRSRLRRMAAPVAGKEARDAEGAEALEGQVVSLWSGGCRVRQRTAEGAVLELDCNLPSQLAAGQQSNLAVGDLVRFVDADPEAKLPGRVLEVLPRRTRLARPDPLLKHLERVVAANVDAVVQISSVIKPDFRPALIDRYLIAIEQGGAQPILCVNKIDLLDEQGLLDLEEELAPYRALDLEIVLCSAKKPGETQGGGVARLRELLAGKTVAFVGHSGVGKSSLLNSLDPEAQARTGEVSQLYNKGRHTTTRASLYELPGGMKIIDTPGIREFGLLDLDAEGLRFYFPDLQELAGGCRFNNCSHSHEPGCAVREAAEEDDRLAARYITYLRLLESLETPAR